jgi:hypothetical protein
MFNPDSTHLMRLHARLERAVAKRIKKVGFLGVVHVQMTYILLAKWTWTLARQGRPIYLYR